MRALSPSSHPPRERPQTPGSLGALALLLAAALLAGCREEPGVAFDCACTYLTDTDDEGKQEERVCAAAADRAARIAKGCAARGAPAPVQGCHCRMAGSKQPCRTGECLSPAKRD